ncbi:MAR-binding filament-like protein 1-1-like protein [Corchorus olitorius]|uniref:MAR-binding filament-like protein 1-1-like protein n=1 Tax=Corchorus olitorius TaxID=93759 RepID=A0A1R3H946_9ROSI|nr:MAR-binding filament-like protein 1-1-like protein [Corchorus olitorius]
MGFVIGSSCYLQTPISNSQILFPSSQSVFLNFKNAKTKRRRRSIRPPMASLNPEDPNDDVCSKRRAVLLVGISILPFVQLKTQAEGSTLRRERQRKSTNKGETEGSTELQVTGASEGSEVKNSENIQMVESELNKSVESQIKESELNKSEENQNPGETKRESPSNPFVSLLNGLGIIGVGVLGALYALVQNEKKAADETIESMKIKLEEKEAALFSMKKDFESKLLDEQERRTKQLKEAKEEQLSLMDRLESANNTISGLGQELKNEKRLIGKLKVEIDSLQSNLTKAGEEKRSLEEELKEKLDSVHLLQEKINLLTSELNDKEENIQKLNSSLAAKELELKNLSTTYKQTKEELGKAHSEIEKLKEEFLRNQSELESKNSLVDELNARISSLMVERDNSKQEFGALQEGYNDLKLSSEKKAAADSKLLGEREKEIHQLRDKLELALNDVSKNKAIIADLNQEKEHLKRAVEVELHNVKNMKEELQLAVENLEKSRSEVSDLSKQLKQSRDHCKELESEVSIVRAEFDATKLRLQDSLDEANQRNEVLASELMTTKELLKFTREEKQAFDHELTVVTENRDNLQKELVDVLNKAETIAIDLNEEKKAVSSLNKELKALEKQIVKDKEARKSLETDLEEATKSLDEMNRNILKLSRDLESANAKISSLEDEKMVLYKTLTEQKNATKEARENMEDAHNMVMTLGKERESLEKRAKKLEEELASAKGEILKLRSKINSSKVPVNDQPQQKDETEAKVTVSKVPVNDQPQQKDETAAKVTVSARKGTRRRKSSSSQ